MMLEAVPVHDSRLDTETLQWYADEINYTEANLQPVLSIAGKRMVSCSAWWDPAFGRGGDASVLAVLYADGTGEYWLHHLEYLRINTNATEDEATQQCRMVADWCRKLYVQSVTLETNGIGKFLPAILRREMKGETAVVEISNRRPKSLRILEAFDAVLAARALHIHESIRKTRFIEDMREWRPQGNKGQDDALDAVAGALSQQPVRVGAWPQGTKRKTGWQAHQWHEAKTDFNVME
jgi:hypothetical protein